MSDERHTYLVQRFQKVCDIFILVQIIRARNHAGGLARVVRHQNGLSEFCSFPHTHITALGALEHLLEVGTRLECLQRSTTTCLLLSRVRTGRRLLTPILVYADDLLLARIPFQG